MIGCKVGYASGCTHIGCKARQAVDRGLWAAVVAGRSPVRFRGARSSRRIVYQSAKDGRWCGDVHISTHMVGGRYSPCFLARSSILSTLNTSSSPIPPLRSRLRSPPLETLPAQVRASFRGISLDSWHPTHHLQVQTRGSPAYTSRRSISAGQNFSAQIPTQGAWRRTP